MATKATQFFEHFAMQAVRASELDAALADATGVLAILFLWGHDCPNCDVAKQQMLQEPERYQWAGVTWLHANVYEDPDIGTRFGLHGVPAFLVFRGTRRMGRISPWPGPDPFCAAIARQLADADSGPPR